MTRWTSALIPLLLCAAALAACPGRAHACTYGGCGGLQALVIVGATVGTGLALGSLGVTGMDVSLLMRDRRPDEGLIAANLVVGGLELASGLALALGDTGSEAALGIGMTYVGLGLFQLIYGAIAAAVGAAPDPASAEAASVRAALAPTRGGASAELVIAF